MALEPKKIYFCTNCGFEANGQEFLYFNQIVFNILDEEHELCCPWCDTKEEFLEEKV